MRLLPVWLHVIGVVVWIGGLAWQSHVLAPLAREGEARVFAAAARRARPVTWTAVSLVVLTGFYNVTQLGDLARVMESGAGGALAGKFILVIVAVALSAQRDFAHVTRLSHATAVASSGSGATATATSVAADESASALRTIVRLDRVVLLLALAIIYLGVFVSRGH
jgi:putative copper export protein